MKKLLAVILSIIMVFSCAAVPATAASEDDNMDAVVEIGGNILQGLMDFLHEFIAGIFSFFGMDCPLCENHGMGDVEISEDEIIDIYNQALNKLKNSQSAIKMNRMKNTSLNLENFEGEEEVRMLLEKLLERYEKQVDEEYNYILGESNVGKLTDKIPPVKKSAALSRDAIKSISMSKIGGREIIRIKLKDGIATYQNGKTTNPAGYEGVINAIDFKTLDVRPFTVSKANISYEGISIEAALDSEGRIVSLDYVIPFVMIGTVNIIIPITDICISGRTDEMLRFTY